MKKKRGERREERGERREQRGERREERGERREEELPEEKTHCRWSSARTRDQVACRRVDKWNCFC